MASKTSNAPPLNQRRNPASVLAASTFGPAVRLLPIDLQPDARRLYGLLRTLDDLVDDEDPEAANRVAALERWARFGEVQSPEAEAMAELSRRHSISPEAVLEFCSGMRLDLERATIATEDDLEQYCQYVGGAVGMMLAQLFGTSHAAAATKMAILGRAMQRTNILRDIDEDAARQRLYIPRSTVERYGPPTPGDREELLRDQIAKADVLYDEGLAAIPLLASGRRAMALSAALYREILRQIEREGYGRTAGGVVVPTWRRRLILAKFRVGRR
ncbi:MAG: phytoene/squalene synthase family protein [Solirubrobacteraceae bacterium]